LSYTIKAKGEIMKKPAGVIFDLGDTVLQHHTVNWIPANEAILEYVDTETSITPEELQDIANRINADFEKVRIDSMIEQDVIGFYRLLFDTAGISLSISHEEAAKLCWDTAYRFTPEEGIYEVMDILEKYNIKTGILSNTAFSGTLLEEELEKHDLLRRFSFVISSADYGVRKPHPRIFDIAARKIGLAPQDIWFVGDKPRFDVQGAISAGMHPVWYNPRDGRPDPQFEYREINHWNEFIDIINSFY
jgi:putative hydrolase of the HAD superfamily